MAPGRPRDPRKEQHWQHYVQLWQRSGLSIRVFCERHQLSPLRFYAWRRRLQQRTMPAFVPVHVLADTPPRASTPIEVVLGKNKECHAPMR